MANDVLQVQNLDKFFGRFHVLKQVTFTIHQGEVFALLGPNGAGKSTLIRTILGLLKPKSGQVTLNGHNALTDIVATHQRIAYVPGDVYLWPNLTGGEIIDLLLRMGGHDHTAKTDALIKKFALDPTKKARTYSKGNRQKVALIAAFSADVDLYIFDEPTSGLDPLQALNFQSEVLALKAANKAVLLSSHILDEVEKTADQIAIIRQGEIIETGELQDLQHIANLNVLAIVTKDATGLATMSGVTNLKQDGQHLTFTVSHDGLAVVTQQLAQFGLKDLRITPPTLEEIFLTYYQDGTAHEQ